MMDNNNQSEKLLKKFLDKNRTKSNDYTHTGTLSYVGKYNIKNMKEFYKLYIDVVKSNIVPQLLERPLDISHVRIDMDFRFPMNYVERIYTLDNIKFLINRFNIILNELVEEPILKCFVLEKNRPRMEIGAFVDGLHLEYPFVNVSKKVHLLIRERFLEMDMKEEFVSVLSLKPNNSISKIYDKSVYRNNWHLYGSNIKNNKDFYNLKYVFDEKMNDITDEYVDIKKIVTTLCFRKTCLPSKLCNGILEKSLSMKDDHIKKSNKKSSSEMKDINLDDIEKLVSLLSDDRADDYSSWLNIGMTLFNIDSKKCLKYFIKFSKRTSNDKYLKEADSHGGFERICKKHWKSFKEGDLSLGSLKYWAKMDSPKRYYELFMKDTINEYVSKGVSGSDFDISALLHKLYKNEFVCSSTKNFTWYYFDDNRWHRTEKGQRLVTKIPTKIVSLYEDLSTYYHNKVLSSSDKDDQEKFEKKRRNVMKLINNCKMDCFQERVMKQAGKHFFYDGKFEEKLDKKENLICFSNGVYDLDLNNFRNGLPDDYLSLCTNVKYFNYENERESDEMVFKALDNFFGEIMPDDDIKQYLLRVLASNVHGQNRDQSIHIWTGTGSNGKSILDKLLGYALGDYKDSLPVATLIQKRGSSGSASPEIARLRGVRCVTTQEPDDDAKINTGIMKEMTGDSDIYARYLNENGFIFRPQFKLHLQCNKLPDISANDGGTWRRIRVIHFPSKFVSNPDPKIKYQFKIDKGLTNKIKHWGAHFASLLIHYYKDYKIYGLRTPEKVTIDTNKYKNTNDLFGQFIEEFYEIPEDPKSKDRSKITNIYNIYKNWYIDGGYGKPQKRSDLKIYLEKNFGKMTSKGFRLKFKTVDDSD